MFLSQHPQLSLSVLRDGKTAHPLQMQPLLADHIPTLTCSGALCTLEHASVIHLTPCSIHRAPPGHLCPRSHLTPCSFHHAPLGHLCPCSHLTPCTIHRALQAIYAHTRTSPLAPSTNQRVKRLTFALGSHARCTLTRTPIHSWASTLLHMCRWDTHARTYTAPTPPSKLQVYCCSCSCIRTQCMQLQMQVQM